MIKDLTKNLTSFDKVILLVITLVMANNVEHLAFVHYSIARHALGNTILNKAHSILVVLIVELSIILMVFKGKDVYAGMYTFFLFVLSLIYYPLPEYWKHAEYGKFIASVIYSFMFTLSIWYFSRMAATRQQNAAELDESAARSCNLERELHYANARMMQDKTRMELLEAALHEKETDLQQANKDAARKMQQLEKQLQELTLFRDQVLKSCTCKHCGQQFETEASRRSHEGRCKGKEAKEAA